MRVTRRRADTQMSLAEWNLIILDKIPIRAGYSAGGRHGNLSAHSALEHRCARYVIGMDVGVQGVKQSQAEFFD